MEATAPVRTTSLDGILIGKGDVPVYLLPRYGNRHGFVAGATGTGKTVSLMVLAEGFSRLGVPVVNGVVYTRPRASS